MKKGSVISYPGELSKICMGTAMMGEKDSSGNYKKTDIDILEQYYALGGRFFDTANVYGKWNSEKSNLSERLLGCWIWERNLDDAVILTKGCHHHLDNPDISRVNRTALLQDLDESRAALRMDMLHMYFLHRDDPSKDIRAIVDACVEQVDAGRVQRFGFSNFSSSRVQEALLYLGHEWHRYFVGVSNEWSLALDGATDYEPPDGMMKVDRAMQALAQTYGFALFPYSATARGFFSKLQSCGAVFRENSWQHVDDFRGNIAWLTLENGVRYQKLQQNFESTGFSMVALSAGYLLAQPFPVFPVMSASNVQQMEQWCHISEENWELSCF